MRTRVAATLLSVVLPLAALAGCGGEDATTVSDPAPTSPSDTPGDTPGDTPSTPGATASTGQPAQDPACDEVWVDGAKLPGGYDGCTSAEGRRVKPDGRYCEFGKPLFTYDSRFWAVRGGTVHEADGPMKQDPDYQGDLASCSG